MFHAYCKVFLYHFFVVAPVFNMSLDVVNTEMRFLLKFF